MTVNELKKILHEITEMYFFGITVRWGKVGGVKSQAPSVVLTAGAVVRSNFPINYNIDGEIMSYYPSQIMLEINYDADSSEKENTATNDLEGFLNYINSPYVIDLCNKSNISINQETPVRDLTGLQYETSWQYRAMVELNVGFMQSAYGYAGSSKSLSDNNETGYFANVEITEK